MSRRTPLLLMIWATAGTSGAAPAAGRGAVDHPFMFWTRQELADLRRRVKTDPHARAAFERLKTDAADRKSRARAAKELLLFAVTDEAKLAEAQKKELLRVVRSPIPRGGAQWMTILRYDLLYDRLTAAERAAFEKMARIYIRNAVFDNAVFNPKIFNDSANYSRYDACKYTRTNWLPNIIWPRKVSANLFALALRDEELIRKTWAHYGSWKWYFDRYLCDVGFYSEEFSKMGATPGAMLMYCLAAEHLGLGELGFGYRGPSTGSGRATMRGHIRSLLHLGYPRIDVGTDRPQYPMVTMGDLRQTGSSQAHSLPSPAFQHSIVGGYVRRGDEWFGGNLRWRAHGAWGGQVRGRNPQWDGYGNFTPKMQIPLWFELAAKRWPEDGYAYFLAQMRPPGEELYVPSLWFGLEAIDPAKVEPPPAPSAVWPERGIAMLRADESPAYWESSAPAVAMRLGSNYAHNVHDAFALLGFYAFNRPIYLNRQVWPGYASGWSRSIQSHCGVTVDYAEPKFTDETRCHLASAGGYRSVAAASERVYPGVALVRGLTLTPRHLADITRLASKEPHDYTWILHALGRMRADDRPWRPGKLPGKLTPLRNVRVLRVGAKPWSVTIDQLCALDEASKAKLPRSWYDRRIGVRVSMLGAAGTTVYVADTPQPLVSRREGRKKVTVEVPSEVGGVTLIVTRRAATTSFISLHEPFEGRKAPGLRLRGGAETKEGLNVDVEGPDVSDRLTLRFSGEHSPRLEASGRLSDRHPSTDR